MPYTLPFQLPDLGQAMASAQQLRANQLAIEERERALDRQGKLAGAVKTYRQGGDPTELMLLAPDLYQRFEGMRASEMAAGSEREVRRAKQSAGLAAALRSNPGAYEAARGALLRTGDWAPEELPPVAGLTADSAGQLASQLESVGSTVAGVAPPAQAPDLNLVDAIEKAAFRNFRADFPGSTPEQAISHPQWGDYLATAKAEALAGRRAGATRVSVSSGRQELEKSPKGKLQTELVGDEQMAQDLQSLQSMNTDQFLTAYGRIKGNILRNLDYLVTLPKGSQEFVAQRRVFRETVEQLFNAYRHRITGAQAADKELKLLRGTIINTDLSPSEFAGSLKRFTDQLQRAMRLKRKVLREGIDVSPDKQAEMFDKLWKAGDKAAGAKDVSDRILELLKAGTTPDVAAQQMVSEGYMTQEQADDFLMRAQGK